MEFKKFDSIPRLSKDMVITEKVDGTNACVVVMEDGTIFAQSRNKIITPTDDNHGFAKWVESNKEELLKLGVGYHFGEWYGCGIQRWYELKEKCFALFFYRWEWEIPDCCGFVPELYRGIFDTVKIQEVMDELYESGSKIAPGFRNPEWVVIYHTGAGIVFKRTFENDEGKWSKK